MPVFTKTHVQEINDKRIVGCLLKDSESSVAENCTKFKVNRVCVL